MGKIQSLSSKERRALIRKVEELFEGADLFLPKKGGTSRYVNEKGEVGILIGNKDLILIEKQGYILPSLKIARKVKLLTPKIVVDIGAIRFVTNGADVMRPGIVKIDDRVIEGDLVVVTDEKNDAPLSFGISLYDAVDMKSMKSGKCIKNLHHLTDEWWDFEP